MEKKIDEYLEAELIQIAYTKHEELLYFRKIIPQTEAVIDAIRIELQNRRPRALEGQGKITPIETGETPKKVAKK